MKEAIPMLESGSKVMLQDSEYIMKKILVDMRVFSKILSSVAKESKNLYQEICIKAATLKGSFMGKDNTIGRTEAFIKETSRTDSKMDMEY